LPGLYISGFRLAAFADLTLFSAGSGFIATPVR